LTPSVSIALPPSSRVVSYARAAERAGCRRVWIYDSPALYGDVWIAVSLVAQATERIGVGTGVAVPTLRHPLVTASAIASIEELAPGRPGGAGWRSEIDRLRPEPERHLAVHEGHISTLTDRDRAAIEAAGEAILGSGWTGSKTAMRARAEAAAAAGITELVYAPVGPAIESEIERFVEAVTR
jgi:hypothetical protein